MGDIKSQTQTHIQTHAHAPTSTDPRKYTGLRTRMHKGIQHAGTLHADRHADRCTDNARPQLIMQPTDVHAMSQLYTLHTHTHGNNKPTCMQQSLIIYNGIH